MREEAIKVDARQNLVVRDEVNESDPEPPAPRTLVCASSSPLRIGGGFGAVGGDGGGRVKSIMVSAVGTVSYVSPGGRRECVSKLSRRRVSFLSGPWKPPGISFNPNRASSLTSRKMLRHRASFAAK